MPIKRKIRNLPNTNDQMSFFDPVYSNNTLQMSDDENENNFLSEGIPRPVFEKGTKDEVTKTNDQNRSSEMFSATRIISRIKEIQNSIEQAESMLASMDKFKDLIPDNDEQYEKLRSLIVNLQEQQASYINLLNLITLTSEEPLIANNRNSTSQHQTQLNMQDEDNTDLALRRNVQTHVEHPTGSNQQPMSLSDNEQANRNDNSNYDSLVGSLKSDTINWKDQQATSNDEETDAESEKEIQKNLMLQKEQLRALQGQQRALVALKKRSEQRLVEQQELNYKNNTSSKTILEENDLLSDIHNIRNRLKTLRDLYEQKFQTEIQHIKNSSNKSQPPSEKRLKTLEHVRQRLDDLEQIVANYQTELSNEPDEDILTSIDEVSYLKNYLKEKSETNYKPPKQLDNASNELAAKRLELEQAKNALAQLQLMVKKIQPDECSSSARTTPIQRKISSKSNSAEWSTNSVIGTPGTLKQSRNETPTITNKSSLLSQILSSQPAPQSLPIVNNSVDSKMVAQHREIERLIESRQRLHTIKDQIASLKQTMTTPTMQQKSNDILKTDSDKLNDSKNLLSYRQPSFNQSDNNLDLYPLEDESDDEKNQSYTYQYRQKLSSPMKQTNFCPVERMDQSSNELGQQMREICRCLSTFIDEQKLFNRSIEQRLTNVTKSSSTPINDQTVNQIQQQNLTQSLVVNLNAAYREIAVLQSEINQLQSENIRLTSSLSFDNECQQRIPPNYSRIDSRESIYSLDRINPSIRSRPRPKFDEQRQNDHVFENSPKPLFNTQNIRKQTLNQTEKMHKDTKPMKYEDNVYLHSQPLSLHNNLSNNYDNITKGNPTKSFIIHRRPIANDNETHQGYDYKQKRNQQSQSSLDDYQQIPNNQYDSDNEAKPNVENTQLSSYYTSTNQDLENVDTQTLDLQVKSIMVQLIPFMRIRIDEIFNRSTLHHIRERLLFLFKQQPDSAEFIRHFQNQFSELIEKTIEKYIGTSIRDCAADLIRDISDLAYDELVKYKAYESTQNIQTKIHNNAPSLNKQEDEYSQLVNMMDPSMRYQEQQRAMYDDGDNDDKYQIELAESENRPLTLIGSDEEDNDADQEENTDSELETAVSRQGTYFDENESPVPTNSNGHEYVLVNRSESDEKVPENDERKNDDNENIP